MTKPSKTLTIASILISLVMLAYVGILLSTNYLSQASLKKTLQGELKLEIERRAANLGNFFSVRREDMVNLASSRELAVFFENRALGMSMEYGLKQSLPPIKERFFALLNRYRIGVDTAYVRIVLLDDGGRLLADARSPDRVPGVARDLKRLLAPAHRSAVVLANDPAREILVSTAYYFKGTYAGQIIAWLQPEFIHDHLMADTRSSRHISYLVSERGTVFVPRGAADMPGLGEIETGEPKELETAWRDDPAARMLALKIPVPETPFFLLSLADSRDVFGPLDPRGLLTGMGVLAVVLIGAVLFIVKLNMRSMVLQAHLEASLRHEEEVSKKNRQLEIEMTERKHAESALRISEEQYRTLIETSPDVIYTVSAEGAILSLNSAFENTTGWSRDAWLGKSFLELIHPDDHPLAQRTFEDELQGKSRPRYELRCLTKSGEYHIAEFTSTGLMRDGRIIGTFGIARDITERKKLEEQLRQAVKMQAVGQLAGGIAHDFNNMLTVIIGYCTILLEDMKPDDPLRPYADLISSSAEQAAQLTQNLLAFSRKQILNMRAVDVNVTVRTVEHLVTRLIGEDIKVSFELSESPLTIMADSAQIGQVLMNLAANARDAMQGGGRLMISAYRIDMDEDFKRSHGFGNTGAYAAVSITDTGSGMDDAIREHIFEPFFTTKEVGKGTGLGLAIVFGIVKQHRGYIDVLSKVGKGTTFTLYFPLLKTEPEGPGRVDAPARPRGGTETILIAEDNDEVSAMLKRVLKGAGYTVIEAANGKEAVSRYKANAHRIRMLVFDVVMPTTNGKDAYEAIKALDPDIKVLFISGYAADVLDKSGIQEKNVEFLAKPIKPAALLARIREVLDR